MNVVVDASVAFKWLVVEDDSDAAVLLLRNNDVLVPDVLLAECRNAALTNIRRRLLTIEEARQTERDLEALALQILPSRPHLNRAFAIGLELGHPIYDCIYLAVAIETGRTLVTADERFATRAATLQLGRDRVTLLGAFDTGR